MKTGITAWVGAALLGVGSALAADPQSGEALYATCVACHGSEAAGNPALNAPALAGQLPDYLARQIRHFQAGVRGADPRDSLGRQMQGMAATLDSDDKIAAVVAYIGSLPAANAGDAPDHDRRNGEVQYNASCGACHGAAAQGNAALNAPRLAGLDEAYLRRQYGNFAEGIRGSDPDDKYGRQMQMMSGMLATEKDLDDVIGFILSR